MDSVEIKIMGMTCGHCVNSVTRALLALPGVEKAEVSLENKKALVWGSANKESLVKAINDIGFEAS